MAGKKRKSADSATPRQTPASTRPSQRIKPSVEFVEISSDEPQQPALGGVLRGLSLNNVLPTPKTQQSVELDDDDDDDALPEPNKENRLRTRGDRHGRTVEPIKYDMKCRWRLWLMRKCLCANAVASDHDIDEYIRPSNAKKRRAGSRSVSAPRGGDRDTSEASQEEDHSEVEELPARIPDPKATRRSKRAEANKAVNYNSKTHPQDAFMTGYGGKAAQSSHTSGKHSTTSASPEVAIPRGLNNFEDGVVICDSDDDEPELEPDEPSRARKKLRTLSDARSSPQKPRRNPRSPKKSSKAATGQSDPLVDTLQEIQDYIDNDLAGESMPQGLASSDRIEAVQNLNGLVDSAEMSSSTGLDLAKVAAKEQRPIAGVDTFASDEDEETEADPEDFANQIQSQYWPVSEDEGDDPGFRWDNDDSTPMEDNVADGEHRIPGPTVQRLSQLKAASAGDTGVRDTSGGEAEGQDADKRSSLPEPHSDSDVVQEARFTSFGRVVGSQKTIRPGSPQRPQSSGPSSDGDLEEAQRNALKRPQSGTGLYNSANRKPSSSSRTFGRSSTRVESSSSALKTSSRVNSRVNSTQRATGDEQQPQAGKDAPVRQNSSLVRSKNDSSGDQDLESTGDDVGDEIRNGMASSSKRDPAGNSGQHSVAQYGIQSLPATKTGNGQTVSPATSFDDNAARKLADTAISEQQPVAGSAVTSGQQVRSQVSGEDSLASLQSPAATPERSAMPARPSQRIGLVFSSDPSYSPVKEPSDPASSTDPSSPSKFLDEEL